MKSWEAYKLYLSLHYVFNQKLIEIARENLKMKAL